MIVEELELVPTDEPERRRAPRPKPPQPAAMAPRMRQLVDWLVEWVESGWLGWAVYALLIYFIAGFAGTANHPFIYFQF